MLTDNQMGNGINMKYKDKKGEVLARSKLENTCQAKR